MKSDNNFKTTVIKLIFPDRCPYCRTVIESDMYCCDKCKNNIPQHTISQGISGGYRCVSTMVYHGKFRRALLNFKFYHKTSYCEKLAYVMAQSIKRGYPDYIFDYITYVPMHKRAYNRRGYNQCEMLAKELSKLLHIPCVNTLTKIKNTKPQHKLRAAKRRGNLKGAFALNDKNLIKGKSVLIIDDVVTTGTTLGECAKTLQKAKPSMICCATLLTVADLY